MTPPRLEISVLGPVELRRDGASVPAGGPKQRALLAYLLLNARTTVSLDSLVGALWESPPRSAKKIVRMYASRLRRLLEDGANGGAPLLAERGAYRLQVEDEQIDLGRFERLVREGETALRRGDHAGAAKRLRAALSLWRGDPLADLGDEPFVAVERARLEELRLAALERRVDGDLAAGEHQTLVPELEALISNHPFREAFRAQLMLALYRSGRQADALEVYRRTRETLVGELGIEPGQALQGLEHAILRHDPDLEAPAGRAATPSNLPIPPTPLVGRKEELDAVCQLLRRDDVRLVTLTGPGGIGKTRLALEAARQLLDDFPDGVYVTALAPVADPDVVLPTVAQTIGVPVGDRAPAEALRHHLRDRTLLLVFDNLEHLLAAGPGLVELLSHAPSVKAVVTSRAVLHVSGEHEFPVPPLELPQLAEDTDHESLLAVQSVALFVQRAEAVRHGFALTEDNGPAVAEICRRLEGLPLAIELAAARSKLVPPSAMLNRLAHRLDLLAGGARDAPRRQRTLRATIDWSYDLLDQDQQLLLARLAIFVGGWTLEDAEAIVNGGGDILDGLASLVDESLVRQESEGEPRFTMLETIRDYAAERLESSGEAEDLRQRHATRFLEVAEESEHGLTGPDQLQWLRLLETEQDNLRAALAWAVQARRGDVALRLASALTRFWHTRSFLNEGRTWLAAALEVGADQPPELRGKALTRLGVLLLRLGLAGETKPLLEESLALHREIGDPEGTALSLIHLSHVAVREGDSSSAEQMLEESLALYESLGDQRGIAVIRVNLGYVAVTQGEYARSIRPLDQSLAFFEEIGDRLGTAHAAFNLGLARLFQGRPEEAEEALGKALRCAASVGSTEEIICSLVCLAAAAHRRDPERTARLLGAAERLGEEIAFVLDPFEQDLCDETAARVRAALSAATFEQAWNAGRALDCDQAVALASTAHA